MRGQDQDLRLRREQKMDESCDDRKLQSENQVRAPIEVDVLWGVIDRIVLNEKHIQAPQYENGCTNDHKNEKRQNKMKIFQNPNEVQKKHCFSPVYF